MQNNKLPVKIIRINKDMPLPAYATEGSAAFDLYANIDFSTSIAAGTSRKIPTGIKLHIADPNYAAFILPRSGFGSAGAGLKNLIGLIDSDYQGELLVNIWNTNTIRAIEVPGYRSGKAFAQCVILPVKQCFFEEVESFEEITERAEGGFGSTDK
jgi:dUTP pyrophosphatase